VARGGRGVKRGSTSQLVALIGVVLIVLGALLVVKRVQTARIVVSDFTQDYVAALALREGRSIYDEFPQSALQAHMPEVAYLVMDTLPAENPGDANEPREKKPIMNFHPPFNAVMFLPISVLPYDSAIVLWSIFTLLLYLWVGHTLLRELDVRMSPPYLLLLVGVGLCWYQFQVHMVLGQLSLLVVAGVVGCWSLLRRGHDLAGGALLGLACLIKLFPGLLFIYLIVRRRWLALAAGIGVLAIGGGISLAVVGLDDMLRYAREIAPLNVVMYGPNLGNLSVTGAWHRLLVGSYLMEPLLEAPQLAALLVRLSSVALLALLVFQVWRTPATQHNNDTAFALFCVAMLLLSPITWGHVFPVLLLPLGLLLHDVWNSERRRLPHGFLVVLVILWLPDIHIVRYLRRFYYPAPIPWLVGQVLLVQLLALALLWWLLARRFHSAKAEQEADG